MLLAESFSFLVTCIRLYTMGECSLINVITAFELSSSRVHGVDTAEVAHMHS